MPKKDGLKEALNHGGMADGVVGDVNVAPPMMLLVMKIKKDILKEAPSHGDMVDGVVGDENVAPPIMLQLLELKMDVLKEALKHGDMEDGVDEVVVGDGESDDLAISTKFKLQQTR